MNDEQQSNPVILFRWRWNIKLLCFAFIFLPLMVSLGFWQLDRAAQKESILEAQRLRVDAKAVEFSSVVLEPENQFRNVFITGIVTHPETKAVNDERIFLVDNKVRHGRPGYEVLVPLKVRVGDSDQWLLVNRGWLSGGMDRRVLPPVPALGSGAIRGYLYRSPGKAIVLKDQVWEKNAWPLVIQSIDVEKISTHLGLEVYPYILRVAENPASGNGNGDSEEAELETGWQVVNALPEKSIGYAVQWFAMALALLILSIFANSNLADVLKRTRQENKSE